LLAILVFAGTWAALIPIPALAGILLVVAWNMSEWRHFVHLFRMPRSDVLVLLTTFSLTVLIDLTIALQTGIVLAALLFMRRMATLSQAGYVTRMMSEEEDADDPLAIAQRDVPPGVEVFEVQGALFFGAATKFRESINQVETPPRVLIVRMRKVPAIDASGLRELEVLHDDSSRRRTALVLSGVHAQPLVALERSGLLERFGADNVCEDIDAALVRARELLATSPGS
jgi:SulP family sulfate permease